MKVRMKTKDGLVFEIISNSELNKRELMDEVLDGILDEKFITGERADGSIIGIPTSMLKDCIVEVLNR